MKSIFFNCKYATCKYTFFGIIFGFSFPVIATAISVIALDLDITLKNIINVHIIDPHLWIIDTAPFFLGLFSFWIGRKTTSRMKTEEHLRRSESKFCNVIQSSLDGMIAVNNRGQIVLFNNAAEKIFGLKRSDVLNQPIEILMPNEYVESHKKIVKDIFNNNENHEIIGTTNERLAKHSSGRIIPIEITLTESIMDEEPLILAVVRDVYDKKIAQQREKELQTRLIKAEKMESLGLLAGGVAHDLNNILGPMVGYPDLIMNKLDEDSPLKKPLINISNSAQEAASIVQDLLTLARRGRYEMKPILLNQVIQAYLDSISFQSLAKNNPDVKVCVNLDDTIGLINGSTSHLSKVIMNLIMNAFDAMNGLGILTIQTSQSYMSKLESGFNQINQKEYIKISISDTGKGINKNDIAKIFEPYYSNKKMGKSGSGLGLSVVYGVLKDHNGHYDVLSEEGKGTEFILYFPVTTEAEKNEVVDNQKFGGDETILVVDDMEAQRDLSTEILSNLGYKTETAVNGTEAIKYLKHHNVNLVMLDMIMEPDFDGLDTYREIVKINPTQKAVIVSGFSPTERVRELQHLGAGEYVKKPYTSETLGRAIRRELDRTVTPNLQGSV